MKLFCKGCGHRCHCLGKGYYVSETFCESCSCNHCTCVDKPLILTKPIQTKKSKNMDCKYLPYYFYFVWIIKLY
jgi:hypothetical protein